MSRKQPPPPEDVDGEPPKPVQRGRLDRDKHRGEMLDLRALANRIAALPQSTRRTLPFDEELQAQFDLLAGADGRTDRRRVVMRAKLLLGAVDPVLLAAALQGDTAAAAWERESVRWRTRLIAGDDRVLQEFVEAFPHADRQALRTSAREARAESPAGKRAFTRVLQLVRAAALATDAAEE